jgi:hypothetical protein
VGSLTAGGGFSFARAPNLARASGAEAAVVAQFDLSEVSLGVGLGGLWIASNSIRPNLIVD